MTCCNAREAPGALHPDAPAQSPAKIFMAVGEISGDRQAAWLARSLLEKHPDVKLFGSGGRCMREAGVDVRVETAQLGFVGLQEALSFHRPIRHARRELRQIIDTEQPDLAVLVDGERFNGPLASHLRAKSIPIIYYYPPQVWLWGRWRTRAIARKARLIIPAFPAEVDLYRSKGGRVQWCGHPLLDLVKPAANYQPVFRRLGLDPALPVMAVMPGSRIQELDELSPIMFAAVQRIKTRHPQLQFILPLAAPHLRVELEARLLAAGLQGQITMIDRDVYTCLARCEAVMLSSGTATLEVALLGVPMVVTYRVKPLTYFVGRQVVNTRFIALPNILLQETVVPELIQKDFTLDRLVAETLDMLENQSRRSWVRSQLSKIPSILGTTGAISRAAHLILEEGRSCSNSTRA